jgi:hypothetical protein
MKKITKNQARKLFEKKVDFFICACKLVPFTMYHWEMKVNSHDYIEYYKLTYNVKNMTKKDYIKAFDNFYNNYTFYNCNYEMGYYPSYYA